MTTNRDEILLLGAGGHGKVCADTAGVCGFNKISFHDDRFPSLANTGKWLVTDKINSRGAIYRQQQVFISVGDNTRRAELDNSFGFLAMPVLKHPSAIVSSFSEIGFGTILVAGAIVNVDVRIGRGVILNTGCTIDHDCVLGDHVHISPGANIAGCVNVGNRTWVGIGASVKEGVKIGADCIIGAGTCVIRDVPDNSIVTGIPGEIKCND